jgi:GAF domain-containing protein
VYRDRVPRNVANLDFDLTVGSGVALGPALTVPMRAGNAIVGVLLAARVPGAPSFDDRQLQVVSLFADQAALALQRAESQAAQLVIDVTDNGAGIPDTVARSGLHNLASRAADAGGACAVERLPAGGTRLLWSAPVS